MFLTKWGYLPFTVAALLVRDEAAHRAAFGTDGASYLLTDPRGPLAGGFPFADLGIDLTRPFKALKVWMTLKAQGVDSWIRLINQNVAQAQYLARRIDDHLQQGLELVNRPVQLNVVCFRYVPPSPSRQQPDRTAASTSSSSRPEAQGEKEHEEEGEGASSSSSSSSPSSSCNEGTHAWGQEELNAVNKELVTRIQERGVVLPSSTTLRGCYVIRVAIVNHRSKLEDFDALVAEVLAIGPQVAAQLHPHRGGK